MQSSIFARFFCVEDSCPGRVLWWTVVAGPLLRVEPVFGETQEETVVWNPLERGVNEFPKF